MHHSEDELKHSELLDPVDYFLKIVNEHLFPASNTGVENGQQKAQPRPALQVENEFERFKIEYEATEASKLMMLDKKNLEKIFSGYTKASKRGVKIIPLR